MPSIGTLVAALVADTKQWGAGLAVAGSAMGAFTGKVQGNANSVVKTLAKMRNAFLALAAVKEVFRQITDSMVRLDQVAKKADLLGVPIEQMQALGFAAEQTGASMQTMQMGLQRMTRRIAQAAQGQGEAVKALKQLGLSAQDLNKLRPDQQLNAIADAMQRVQGQSNKVALAFKLFDSEGVALLNTIAGGSDALRAFGAELAATGAIITREEAARVEKANDAMNKMRKTWEGLITKLAVELAPVMEDVAAVIVESVKQLMGVVRIAKDFVRGREVGGPGGPSEGQLAGLGFKFLTGGLNKGAGPSFIGQQVADMMKAVEQQLLTQRIAKNFQKLGENTGTFVDKLGEAIKLMAERSRLNADTNRQMRELKDAEPGIAIRNAQASLEILRDRLVALDRQTPRLAQAPAPGGGTSNAAIAQQVAQFSQPQFEVANRQLEVQRQQLQEEIAQKMILIQIQKSLQPAELN